MHRILLIFNLVILSCSMQESESDLLSRKNPDGFYGNKIVLEEYSSFKNLMSYSHNYLNKDVLIKGEIVEVCPMRGCWINVKDNNSDIIIRVKVTDGMIVFPLSSKSKQVDVQGKFTRLNFTEQQAKNWKVHLAAEQGIVLKHEDIVLNESDLVEYRIVGESAQIYSYGCK